MKREEMAFKRRTTVFALVFFAAFFDLCESAETQQTRRFPRIGILVGIAEPNNPSITVFRQAMQDLGYLEGKNIRFEYRYTEGDRQRIPEIVSELVNLKVDLLFSTQGIVIRVAKEATKSIPIVMAITADPVTMGLVDSLARPGGNVTGITSLARQLTGKRLELLSEIIPKLSRVAILSAVGFSAVKDYQDAARNLNVALQILELQSPTGDLRNAFQAALRDRVGAMIVVSVPGLSGYRKRIVDLAVQNRLPLMSESVAAVEVGGLVSYHADNDEVLRRAAIYIDKILKGAKPADLPVEQASKFELVINLKTAKQIGVTIPPNVLARADRVIR
jgi:putative ABC transport system substrate-binding protein